MPSEDSDSQFFYQWWLYTLATGKPSLKMADLKQLKEKKKKKKL
jgi:hypothetical protein